MDKIEELPVPRAFQWLLAAFVLLILDQLSLILLHIDPRVRLIVNDICAAVISLCVSMLLFHVAYWARRCVRRYWRLWLITAAALFAWFIGDVLWMVIEVLLRQKPYPSIADPFYIVYYLLSIVAILHFPARERTRDEKIKIGLVLSIVIVSATLIFYIFLIAPALTTGESLLSRLAAAAYPVMDLLLFWALLIFMARPNQDRSYLSFVLLGVGISIMIATDVLFSLMNGSSAFATGEFLDLGWEISILMYGFAAWVFMKTAAGNSADQAISDTPFLSFLLNRVWPFMPYLWMLAAFLVLVLSFHKPLPIKPLILQAGVGITIALVVIRQMFAYRENLELSAQLQNELKERKAVEEALRESEMRYRAIVEDQTDLICCFSPEGKILFVNEAYCRYFGIQPGQSIGGSFMPHIYEEDQQPLRLYLASLGPELPVGSLEHRVVLPDGSIRWQQRTDRVVLDEQGNILEYASVGQDITERKLAEKELDRRVREMSALYDMSMEINAQLELSTLLRSVLRNAADLIDAPMGGLYLRMGDSDQYLLEFRYNLPEAMAGKIIRAGEDCVGQVARTGIPLAIEDYERWVEQNQIQTDFSFRRMLGLPLRVGQQIIGVIQVADDRRAGKFSEDEVRLLTLFADQAAIAVENARLFEQAQEEIRQRKRIEGLLQSANEVLEKRVAERTAMLVEINQKLNIELAERKRAEEQTRASLAEKEVLLKEIHHRVKNNLQVISSLLNLQFGKIIDEATQHALMESQNRVRSMALIHEKIYQSNNLAEVDFSEYINSLAAYLFRSYNATNGNVQLKTMIDRVALDIDSALPCGLILNELISNALKYAFPGGRCGEIIIQLSQPDPGCISLSVEDNGVGLPENFDFRRSHSLGMQLVNVLAAQMDGTIQVESGSGAKFVISFRASGTGLY